MFSEFYSFAADCLQLGASWNLGMICCGLSGTIEMFRSVTLLGLGLWLLRRRASRCHLPDFNMT